MAGIGFQLKKLFNENGVLAAFKAYSYSAIVTIGPMALCILLIIAAQYLLKVVGTPFDERELFTAAVQYAFIFSQIITGGFNLVISRYVADQMFLNDFAKVLSSLYGVISVAVTIGGIFVLLFYLNSPLPFLFKLVSYLFFTELIIIWLQCMYVSALKNYMKIVRSFLAGTVTSVLLVLICIYIFDWNNAIALFICFDIGFLVIILRFMNHIREFFKINNQEYFHFLIYVEKYPLLFFGGLFYTFGLYGHNIVVWQGELQVMVAETFAIAPVYDVPIYYAYLTILPALVIFMVSTETAFYEKYRTYYYRILHSYPLQDILNAKRDLYTIITVELSFMVEVQLMVMLCGIALGIEFLPMLGLTSEQIHIFTIVTIGNLFFVMMYTVVLILLYFDDRKGAFATTFLFGVSSAALTYATLILGNYGFSIFLASFLSLVVVIFRFTNYLNNIDYYTFCAQPLVFREKVTKMARLLNRLNRYQ
jgi:polysaccharide biosynthesis protein PelG